MMIPVVNADGKAFRVGLIQYDSFRYRLISFLAKILVLAISSTILPESEQLAERISTGCIQCFIWKVEFCPIQLLPSLGFL